MFSWEDGIAIALLCVYPLQTIARFYNNPLSTAFGLNIIARRRWALRTVERESRAITAVQTIRNSVLANVIFIDLCVFFGDFIVC
jgi:hypothetical protein